MPDPYTQPVHRHRVRVFVDFWNFTLSMRDVDSQFRTDWAALGPALVNAVAKRIAPESSAKYQGLNFYGSYDPDSDRDRSLRRWATTVVGGLTGVSVSIVLGQRNEALPPSAKTSVPVCPTCGSDLRGGDENGVDVRIATDMIKLARADNYDTAVLVSSDRDFIPVVDFLETRGIKVLHAAFPPNGAHLSRACWATIDVPELRSEFEL